MKGLILFLALILCVGMVSAVDLQEGVTSSHGTEVNLTSGNVAFTDVLSGLSVSTETIIDGEKFTPAKTKTDGDSLTWSTGETSWFIFDDPNTALTYNYNGTFLKETIVLKEDHELSFPLKINDNSRMIPYQGGFRIIPNESLSTDKNGGYPPGIVIATPFGYDAAGHYVPMSYGYDGERLTLEYDRTVHVFNQTLTEELNETDEFGEIVTQYDNDQISYPLTIDPTYYLDNYQPYLVLLMHMNGTAGGTVFIDEMGHTITSWGKVYTNTTTKYLGSASLYSNLSYGNGISTPNTSIPAFSSSAFTQSVWVYTENTTQTGWVQTQMNATGFAPFGVIASGGKYKLYASTDGINWDVANGAIIGNIEPSIWQQLVISRNSTHINGYVNGTTGPGFPIANTSSLASKSVNWSIGSRSDGAFQYNGNIDEYGLWHGVEIPISELYPQTTEIETAISPVATFTASLTTGVAPLSVQFNETSISTGTSWEWNATALSNSTTFTFSTVQNASHVFDAGNFSIKLKSTNDGGSNISTQNTWINVSSVITPVASFTPTGTTLKTDNETVQFTDTSTNTPTSWNWYYTGISVGNNTKTQFSTTQNPLVAFLVGNYTISLNVTNAAGTNQSTQVTWINVTSSATTLPTPSFTTNATSGMIPLSILFNDTSTGPGPFTYFWDFGDLTNTTTMNATHTYSSAGVYTVNHSVTNLNGTAYATPVNITATSMLTGFNRVDLEMEEAYVLTVTFRDSVTGAPIPVVTVIDSNGYSQTTSTGIFTYSYPYGPIALYVSSSGYTGKTVSYYIDSDRSETVQLVQTTQINSYAVTYPPKDVRFHLQTIPGTSITGANITAVPYLSSLGNYDYVANLFGYDLAKTPLSNLTLAGTTDSRGDLTFAMMSDVQYAMSFTKIGYTFNNITITPHDDNYIIYPVTSGSTFVTNGTAPAASVTYSMTSRRINQTVAVINISYNDVGSATTSGTIKLYRSPRSNT